MHFITGGAYNGKSRWVKEYYQLREIPHLWISSYKEGPIAENFLAEHKEYIVVMEAVEVWFKHWLKQLSKQEARLKWQLLLQTSLEWEKEEKNRKVIIIGTDMTKGIVPMIAEERKWRDITGWAYQDAVKEAERVDLIWYGINQQLK